MHLQINGIKKEMIIYSDLIPKWQAIRGKLENAKPLAIPKSFLTSKEDGVLVMENLKKQGYKMLDRMNGQGIYYSTVF